MLVSLYRWLRGYLIIQIIGDSPERFLNLCKNKNIFIWKIMPVDDSFNIRIPLKNIYDLKGICKKTGIRIKIIKRCGFPFFIKTLRKRYAFLFGFVICILFLFGTRFCIWEIELNGNHIITEDVMLSFLEQQNIKPGVSKNKINCKELVSQIREEFNNIVWASVSINGTDLCIAIKEKKDKIILNSREDIYVDIIATCPGTVVKMITRSGVPMVSVGDSVETGDLLVVGDADIWIETVIPYENEVLTTYSYKNYDKKEKFYLAYTGKKYTIDLKLNNKTNSMEEILSENIIGLTLNKHKTYSWSFCSYNESDREKILSDELERFCKELEDKNSIIEDKNIKITHYLNKSISTGTIRLIYLHKIWYN